MNPGRFYMPGYMGMRNGSIISPMMRMVNSAPRGMGLFSRITSSIRSVNWSGLLNGANKTLNVVNQAIPLVRQAGPMVNNMRSMLRIAKAFGSETVKTNSNNGNSALRKNSTITNISSRHSVSDSYNNTNRDNTDNGENLVQKKEVYDDNYPNFFV